MNSSEPVALSATGSFIALAPGSNDCAAPPFSTNLIAMLRILQMIAHHPDSASAHQLGLLSSGLSPDIQLCMFPLAAGAKYQLLKNRIRRHGTLPDGVHVWDRGGLMAALITTRCQIFYSIHALDSASQMRALGRLALLSRRIHFVCATEIQKRLLVHAGIASQRCHVIEPGVAPASISHDHRARLRQCLGLGEQDVIAVAPGDSTPTARHRLALWAISILHVYDRRYRLLISGVGAQAQSLHRLANKLRQPALLVSASHALGRAVDPSELPAAADLALVPDSLTGSPLSMALCMTAGAPIIGDANALAGQYVCDDPRALLLSAASPKQLARQIVESFPVGGQRPDRSVNKPLDAIERFSPVRFRRQMCDFYRSVCNR